MSGHMSVANEPMAQPTRGMSDQSFIRFGGLAGVLLAVTSWVSVALYYALVPEAQRLPITDFDAYLISLGIDPKGTLIFNGLYALLGFWALIGIVASYYRVRAAGEAWTFFATLVGAIAAVGTIANGLYQVALLNFMHPFDAKNPSVLEDLLKAQPPTNPYGLMTFALTGLWFLVVALLMLRTNLPKLLAVLGFVAVADLFVGFITALAGDATVPVYAAAIAGGVGGPVFWLWYGVLLLRHKAA
jgi:hypothetical protein